MKSYFGTDGVRANSNSKKLNGITLMKLGMALGKHFTCLLYTSDAADE